MNATPENSETPKSEGERLIDQLDPREAEVLRNEVRVEMGREAIVDPDQLAVPETVTAEQAVASWRNQRDRALKDFQDRLLIERSGARVSQGATSRQLLRLVLMAERRLAAAEQTVARRREWKKTTDAIAEAHRAYDALPLHPAYVKAEALVHLRELEYAAGTTSKRLLNEAREQLANAEW